MEIIITTTIVIIIISYNNNYKFKQELNIHQNEENDKHLKQKILRKQPKQSDLSKSNKAGKTNLSMESTHFEAKMLM